MNPRSPYERISVLIVSGMLFLAPLAHSGTVSDPFGLPKSIVVVSGALLLLLAAILGALSRQSGPPMRSTALYLTAGFLGCAAVAAALSANRGLAAGGLAEIAALAIVSWATARSTRTPQDASWLLRSALAGAALVAAGTLAQVFWPGLSLTLGGWSILPPVPAGATLGDPGLAAQFLILALPYGLGAVALSSGAGRLLGSVALGLILAALLFASRPEGWMVGAGLLGLLALTQVARAVRLGGGLRGLLPDLLGGSLRAAIVSATVLLVVFALSYAPDIAPKDHPVTPLGHVALLAPTTGDPQADRSAAVRGSQALLALHPLGVGLSFWRHAFLEVAWSRVASSPFDLGHQAIHAGNSFVELAAETGVMGGICFAALFLLLLFQAGRTAFLDPGPWGTLGFVSLGTLLGAGLAGLLGSPFQEASPGLLFWTVAGMIQAGLLRSDLPATVRGLGVAVSQASPAGSRRLWAWSALALWAPLAGGGCLWMASRVDAGRRTLAAQSLIAGGDFRRAIEALDVETVRRSPQHLPHVLLADACQRSGAISRAIEAFTSTLERSPWFPAAYLGRAGAWEEQGLYDRADQDLRAALRIWPGGPEILLRRARLDTRRGRLEDSLESYRELARINPRMADAWCGMGELHLRLARYERAIGAFLTCLNRNPTFPHVDLGLGEAYEKMGADEMALRYYKRAASAEATSVAPQLKLANLYALMGQHCNAKDTLLAARDLERDPARRATILDLIDRVDPACRAEQKPGK